MTHDYRVYATRWDSPRTVEEIPASGIEFSMPLSDHGDCSLTATVEPGRSQWRPAVAPGISGLLIARDDVPVWQGWVTADPQTGPRTFGIRAVEWGAFFERVPAVAATYVQWDDHALFRDLITRAALVSGQDPQIVMGTTLGGVRSDWSVKSWDDKTVEGEFRAVGNQADGPEWYFDSAGTMAAPLRRLMLSQRHGHITPQTILEYVEDSADWEPPEGLPSITLLGSLFPGGLAVPATRRRGGNVVAPPMRTRDTGSSATQTIAIGSGEEVAQLRATRSASTLLAWGWPRLTRTTSYTDITIWTTLDRHARADLAATAGLATGYSLVTFDGAPDWTQTPRGSSVRVLLDTDVYGAERPVGGQGGFTARLLNTTVRIPDDGPAQVQWDLATVLDDL